MRSLLATLVLSAPLAAQLSPHVLVVDASGAGDFTVIQDAVAAADSGDRLLVRAGVYDGFSVIGKTLAIEADAGAHVEIRGRVSVQSLISVESVVLRRLHTADTVVPADEVATLLVQGGIGKTFVEDCTFGLGPSVDPALSDFDAPAMRAIAGNAVLVRSAFRGGRALDGSRGGAGLKLFSSNLWVHDCELIGGPGIAGTLTSNGAPGVIQEGGYLQLFGTRARGGDGAPALDPLACLPGGDGAEGVRMTGNSPVQETLDVDFQGGDGGASACGPDGLDARGRTELAVGLTNDFEGATVGVELDSPVLLGETLGLQVTGEPGDVVLVLANHGAGHVEVPSSIGWRHVPSPARILARVTLPASGSASLTVSVPPIPGTHFFGASTFRAQAVGVRFPAGAGEIIYGAPSATGILRHVF